MSRVQVPVIVSDLKPRKDRSWKLTFETRELTSDDVKILVDHFQGEGWMQFSPNDDLPAPPASPADAGAKSPSERLRGVMYVYWQQQGSKGSFDSFYATKVEELIDKIKEKLDA